MLQSPRDVYIAACESLGCKKNSSLLRTLPSTLNCFPSLIELDLNRNLVGRMGFKAVLAVLQEANNLQRLCLANNGLDDTSVNLLCSVYEAKPCKLVYLDLSDNPIRRKGGKLLQRLASTHRSLQTINLASTQIFPSLIQSIEKKLAANRKRPESPTSPGQVVFTDISSTQPNNNRAVLPVLSAQTTPSKKTSEPSLPAGLEASALKLFHGLDVSKNGVLSRAVLLRALVKLASVNSLVLPPERNITQAFDAVDLIDTGYFSEDDFVLIVHSVFTPVVPPAAVSPSTVPCMPSPPSYQRPQNGRPQSRQLESPATVSKEIFPTPPSQSRTSHKVEDSGTLNITDLDQFTFSAADAEKLNRPVTSRGRNIATTPHTGSAQSGSLPLLDALPEKKPTAKDNVETAPIQPRRPSSSILEKPTKPPIEKPSNKPAAVYAPAQPSVSKPAPAAKPTAKADTKSVGFSQPSLKLLLDSSGGRALPFISLLMDSKAVGKITTISAKSSLIRLLLESGNGRSLLPHLNLLMGLSSQGSSKPLSNQQHANDGRTAVDKPKGPLALLGLLVDSNQSHVFPHTQLLLGLTSPSGAAVCPTSTKPAQPVSIQNSNSSPGLAAGSHPVESSPAIQKPTTEGAVARHLELLMDQSQSFPHLKLLHPKAKLNSQSAPPIRPAQPKLSSQSKPDWTGTGCPFLGLLQTSAHVEAGMKCNNLRLLSPEHRKRHGHSLEHLFLLIPKQKESNDLRFLSFLLGIKNADGLFANSVDRLSLLSAGSTQVHLQQLEGQKPKDNKRKHSVPQDQPKNTSDHMDLRSSQGVGLSSSSSKNSRRNQLVEKCCFPNLPLLIGDWSEEMLCRKCPNLCNLFSAASEKSLQAPAPALHSVPQSLEHKPKDTQKEPSLPQNQTEIHSGNHVNVRSSVPCSSTYKDDRKAQPAATSRFPNLPLLVGDWSQKEFHQRCPNLCDLFLAASEKSLQSLVPILPTKPVMPKGDDERHLSNQALSSVDERTAMLAKYFPTLCTRFFSPSAFQLIAVANQPPTSVSQSVCKYPLLRSSPWLEMVIRTCHQYERADEISTLVHWFGSGSLSSASPDLPQNVAKKEYQQAASRFPGLHLLYQAELPPHSGSIVQLLELACE